MIKMFYDRKNEKEKKTRKKERNGKTRKEIIQTSL